MKIIGFFIYLSAKRTIPLLMVRIFCKNTGEFKEFKEGTYLMDILKECQFERPYPILAAKVNNVVEGLRYRVYNSRTIEFLDYRCYDGRSVYCRSLCFLLAKAANDICPGCKTTMRRPISKGFFCEVSKPDGTPLTTDEIKDIRHRMQQIVLSGVDFHRHEVQTEEAITLFESLGYDDKVKLLQSSGRPYISYYTLDGFADIYYDALLPSVEHLKVWSLEPFHGGMFLRVPNRHNPKELAPFCDQPKTFEILKESLRWNDIMGLRNVGDVNYKCMTGGASELIQVSEALQERKIVQMADEIYRRYNAEENPVRIVLITGPSSSGKTTVCKRLSIHLKACGLRPISFSTDDYFVNRVDTPKLPDGTYDFDNFETVDHDALQADILKLIAGEKVQVPEYNFVTGIREYNGKTLELTPGSILLIEGIHALNPRLTDQVDDNLKYRIFINAITSTCIDDHNCISTSDNRLLRRIVRDYNKGAYSARESISNWPNVRRAEVKWIYPYQESADVLFNSAYLVEFAVLRSHAEHILSTVPKNCPEYTEAHRLIKTLRFFTYVSDKDVPATSLLRSFIGGGNL